jgi:ATP-dependent Clp protease ATP-binding subunit ClpA
MHAKETDDFKAALAVAIYLALRDGAPRIGTDHLVLGALHQSENPVVWLLASKGITLDAVRKNHESFRLLQQDRLRHTRYEAVPSLTAAAKRAIEAARALAIERVDVSHLLVVLLDTEGAGKALMRLALNSHDLDRFDTASLAQAIRLLFTESGP